MRQDAGLLQQAGEPGETEEHRDDLRVGPPGHWIHAGTPHYKVHGLQTNDVIQYLLYQGMCDIVAPLLVVIDDEVTVYSCFSLLMERMIQ